MVPYKRTEHIDGLRSIALISVLFYHCQIPTIFQGGFLGVDVFFVISGYVMTLSIERSLLAQQFAFNSFIRKRVKRLLPTLACVIVISNFIVIHIFNKEDINDVSLLSFSSLFSMSNVHLWLQSNYFDSESYTKPYLHTWSLSLEWQFYLSWALFLSLLHRTCSCFRLKLASITVIGIISVALAQVTLKYHEACAFYNLPFRYFEFIIGSVPAFCQFPIQHSARSRRRSVLSCISLTFLLVQFFIFNSSFNFPGINALPVCLCTVLLIMFLQRTHVNQLISSSTLVWLGRRSYSIYLVHWPMFVFFNYLTNNKSSVFERVGVLLLSIILGILLNYCVEVPFQHQEWSTKKVVLFFSTIFVILLQIICMNRIKIEASNSKSSHMQEILLNSILLRNSRNHEARCFGKMLCHASELYSFPLNFEACNPSQPKQILLLGDSHAADFWYVLNSTYWPMNVSTIQMTGSACNHEGFLRNSKKKHCDALFSKMEEFLEDRVRNIKVAVICVQWDSRLSESTLEELKRKVHDLRNRTQVRSIIIIGPRPEYSVKPLHIVEMITSKSSEDIKDLNFTRYCNPKATADSLLRTFSEVNNVSYVSVMNKLCSSSGSNCKVTARNANCLLYFDSHHFNREGAREVLQEFKILIDDALDL